MSLLVKVPGFAGKHRLDWFDGEYSIDLPSAGRMDDLGEPNLPRSQWAKVDKLASEPHPNHYMACQGKSMLDYVMWNFSQGSNERACTIIETNGD